MIAQEWLPTAFDWRVGVFDQRPLFVCKYFMAPGHWQVIKRERNRQAEGTATAQSIGETPEIVIKTALRPPTSSATDSTESTSSRTNGRCYVIEVNDNPNIDAGNEDGVLRDALYREVMGVFLRRIQEREHGGGRAMSAGPPLPAFAATVSSSSTRSSTAERWTSDRSPTSLLRAMAGQCSKRRARRDVGWSNEVVLHVIELQEPRAIPIAGAAAQALSKSEIRAGQSGCSTRWRRGSCPPACTHG